MLDLRLLGGATLHGADGPLSGPGTRRHPLGLLAILAVAPSGTVSRPKILGLLWPDVDEGTGRNRLTSCLHRARRSVGRATLASVGDDLRMNPTGVGCDVWRFREALEAGDPGTAVGVYAGPFLDGFYLESAAFERWMERERSRLKRSHRGAVEALAEDAEAGRRPAEAARWWRERAEQDPFDSRVAGRLVRALSAAGNRPEALRVAESHVRLLREELGADPDAGFREMVDGRPPRLATPQPERPAAREAARSIAVLPPETVGGSGPSTLAEGIHRGILTRLSEVADLRVIARTSVLRYRGTRKAPSEIGAELGVAWLLESDVQESARAFRIGTRLVETASDRQVWAQGHTGTITAENLFEHQARIIREIVAALRIELTPLQKRRVERHPTTSLEAYRLAVQARTQLDRRTEAQMRVALRTFERAVEVDPGYARAWVGIADALGLLVAYRYADGEEDLVRAEEAVRRALDLDPGSAEAHAALGRLYSHTRDAQAADVEIARAVESREGYADAHSWRAVGHWVLGRPEAALKSARRAVELNPLSPEAVHNLGLSWLINGDPDRALQEARRTRELVPSYSSGALLEGITLYEMDRFGEAAAVLHGISVPWARGGVESVRALSLAAAGDEAGARELLREISEAGDRFNAALVHAALGEREAALQALESWEFGPRAFWPFYVPFLRYYFRDVWAPLRDDPRWDEVQSRVDESLGVGPAGA